MVIPLGIIWQLSGPHSFHSMRPFSNVVPGQDKDTCNIDSSVEDRSNFHDIVPFVVPSINQAMLIRYKWFQTALYKIVLPLRTK